MRRYAVPLPAASASPRQVVLAFLRALDAHDDSTAEHLVATDNHIEPDWWLADTASLTNMRITGLRWDVTYGQYAGGQYAHAWVVSTSGRAPGGRKPGRCEKGSR